MDKTDLDRRAAELGLEKLARDHAADLDRALTIAKVMAGRLPRDLHWAEEPAHTYSLTPRSDKDHDS